jgi:hypothetical protein
LYPRLGLLETVLSSKFFPAAAFNKLGFKVNNFNGDAELLDDLVLTFLFSRLHSELIYMKNDHWTSKLNKVHIWHFEIDFWFIRFC